MMAMDTHFLFPYQPSWDWDPHTFGAGDLHEQLVPLSAMEMESPVSSQASTGYLQDAVAEWSDRCKRRRLTASSPVHDSTTNEGLQNLLQGFWDSSCHGDPSLHDLSYMLQDNVIIPDDPFDVLLKANTEVTGLQHPQEPLISSSTSYEEPHNSNELHGKDPPQSPRDTKPCSSKAKALTLRECERRQCSKTTKAKMSVVYPFAVVKPGGAEGDVTLDDINARILMRPRRPVRHPVGEYAQGPRVSPDGPGLSGKVVVSLTRIQTRGRGTITIIRTKG
ncbi:protein XRI1-like [Musa acuminata AAA Group]|uniref:protein XRI1-like n=1 Tax=Musa acuminata AAA Group TaxID=214697 RepID=UPI0031D851F3